MGKVGQREELWRQWGRRISGEEGRSTGLSEEAAVSVFPGSVTQCGSQQCLPWGYPDVDFPLSSWLLRENKYSPHSLFFLVELSMKLRMALHS